LHRFLMICASLLQAIMICRGGQPVLVGSSKAFFFLLLV
jgi:hypothetical protein